MGKNALSSSSSPALETGEGGRRLAGVAESGGQGLEAALG